MGLLCVLWEETLAEMEQGHRSDRGVGSALTRASPASTGCGVRWCPESLSSGKGGATCMRHLGAGSWAQAGRETISRCSKAQAGRPPPGLGLGAAGQVSPFPTVLPPSFQLHWGLRDQCGAAEDPGWCEWNPGGWSLVELPPLHCPPPPVPVPGVGVRAGGSRFMLE